jgi:hypothetical protein
LALFNLVVNLHERPALNIVIRKYNATDELSCLGIFDSNLPRYFAHEERPEFASFLKASEAEYFVAEIEGDVVACGGYEVHGSEGGLI